MMMTIFLLTRETEKIKTNPSRSQVKWHKRIGIGKEKKGERKMWIVKAVVKGYWNTLSWLLSPLHNTKFTSITTVNNCCYVVFLLLRATSYAALSNGDSQQYKKVTSPWVRLCNFEICFLGRKRVAIAITIVVLLLLQLRVSRKSTIQYYALTQVYILKLSSTMFSLNAPYTERG